MEFQEPEDYGETLFFGGGTMNNNFYQEPFQVESHRSATNNSTASSTKLSHQDRMTLQYKKQQAMLRLKQADKENVQSNACAIKFKESKGQA